ncbi:hypothetical protein WM014_00090 [Bifidobacterium mongoliense]|uniref:hypothetical protein n=1 Tax=Bifidobacterium mongoliense TaxID=518643 RepID=UPI0030EC66DD
MKSRQTIGMRVHLVTDDGVEVGTGVVDMPITLTHPKVVKAGEVVQVEVSVDAPPTLVKYSINTDKERALTSRPSVAEDRDARRLTEHKTTTSDSTDRDGAVES